MSTCRMEGAMMGQRRKGRRKGQEGGAGERDKREGGRGRGGAVKIVGKQEGKKIKPRLTWDMNSYATVS